MRKLLYALAFLAFVGCSDGADSGVVNNNNNDNTTNEENTGSDEDSSTEFVPSFTPRYASEGEIKVMSFNVRLKTTEDNPANEWPNRKDACITMIKHQQPTVFGVQEAKYNDQYLELKRELASSNYECYGLNRDTGEESGNGETMAIFYDKTKVKYIEGGTFWLSETPDVCSKGWDGACNRTATWGLFEHIATGKIFCYINTHLDHKGEEAKMNGPEVIMEYFEKYNPDGEYPQFLTGDMNLSPDHKALDAFEKTMVNTRTAAPSNRTDRSATYNGWKKTSNSIIDHIFCSKDMDVVEYHTVNEDYGVEYISDHYPIYAIIKMK